MVALPSASTRRQRQPVRAAYDSPSPIPDRAFPRPFRHEFLNRFLPPRKTLAPASVSGYARPLSRSTRALFVSAAEPRRERVGRSSPSSCPSSPPQYPRSAPSPKRRHDQAFI